MNYRLSEQKESFDQIEQDLLALKKQYQKPKMSERQIEKLHEKMEEAKNMNKKKSRRNTMIKVAAAAAAVGIFIILPNTSMPAAHAMMKIPLIGKLVEVVTFRDYEYESDRNMADIEVPEIKVEGEHEEQEVQEKLDTTVQEINTEIQEITDKLVEEFELWMEDEEGYQDIVVKSEVLTTTEQYFTLKLICYQGAGSGYQWNYYYTIDLSTGERLALKDIFEDGADYITPISENIKEQMRAQMEADENVYYWLDDEIEEWNFKSITDETSFYLNEKNNVVIGFNEGDVAPMYMGTVEFEIPAEALSGIRKEVTSK